MHHTERPRHFKALSTHPVIVVVDVLNFLAGDLFNAAAILLPVITVLVVLALQDAAVCLAARVVPVVAKASFSVQHKL